MDKLDCYFGLKNTGGEFKPGEHAGHIWGGKRTTQTRSNAEVLQPERVSTVLIACNRSAIIERCDGVLIASN